jgi:hypothetical protein
VTQQRHGAGPLAQAPRVGRAQPLRHRRWSLRRLLRCEYSGRTVGMGRSLLAPLVALLYDAIALPYARLPHSGALRAALCSARLGSARLGSARLGSARPRPLSSALGLRRRCAAKRRPIHLESHAWEPNWVLLTCGWRIGAHSQSRLHGPNYSVHSPDRSHGRAACRVGRAQLGCRSRRLDRPGRRPMPLWPLRRMSLRAVRWRATRHRSAVLPYACWPLPRHVW